MSVLLFICTGALGETGDLLLDVTGERAVLSRGDCLVTSGDCLLACRGDCLFGWRGEFLLLVECAEVPGDILLPGTLAIGDILLFIEVLPDNPRLVLGKLVGFEGELPIAFDDSILLLFEPILGKLNRLGD